MKLHANVCSQWEWTKLRQLLVIVLLGLGIVSTYGQTKTVSGIVKSESGDESTGTYTRDMNEMAKYFNMVRYRAGLPGLTTDELSSADKMFDIIVRERMIEFLHENRRFYDVRRWGIYLDTEKEPIVGMNTDGFEDEFFQRTTVNHLFARTRVADKKMVFLPIPRAELRKVPLMDQNPGWDN